MSNARHVWVAGRGAVVDWAREDEDLLGEQAESFVKTTKDGVKYGQDIDAVFEAAAQLSSIARWLVERGDEDEACIQANDCWVSSPLY